MILEKILYVAVCINLIATFYYCRDIFYGHTKPNLISWFFWMLIPFIGVFFQIKAGAGLSILPVFLDGFNSLVIIFVSFWNHNSYWKISGLDIMCGILALTAVAFFILTHNLGISIFFAIAGDVFASIPTLVKSWKFPESETSGVYLVAAITNILGILIIKNWIFTIYSFGLYLAIINLTIVFCIYRKKLFKQI